MIPKVIHYCWFGHNQKSAIIKQCMESWIKYCPNYEFIEWNEENFDISVNKYVQQAYEAKKWAFVTDYARLWIIYNKGGIYLDTDVELIKNLDDLLNNNAYFGFEDTGVIATGLGFGAEKYNPLVKKMMECYEEIPFIREDGRYDLLPCPIRNTEAIQSFFPSEYDITNVIYLKDAVIYPPEYFCPLSADGSQMKKTKHTYSIHWFSATWLTDEEKIIHDYRIFKNKCIKLFGKSIGSYVTRFIYLLQPKKRAILKVNSNSTKIL